MLGVESELSKHTEFPRISVISDFFCAKSHGKKISQNASSWSFRKPSQLLQSVNYLSLFLVYFTPMCGVPFCHLRQLLFSFIIFIMKIFHTEESLRGGWGMFARREEGDRR